jgi:lipid-binding SYLF domain-containing protein
MRIRKQSLRTAVSALQAAALLGAAPFVLAQDSAGAKQGPSSGNASTSVSKSNANTSSGASSAATKHVDDAAAVVRRMASEPALASLMSRAKGTFIIPSYGRAALGLGASGGAGVFLEKTSGGTWSDPAFFNVGGISVGLQAGAEGGPVVMLLMNDKAVASFRQKNNFNLRADAGLTVVNWSRQAQGSVGTGDVIVWSGAKGLFGNVATLAINDIRFNQKATQSYYGKPVTVQDVVSGKATNPQADSLKQALAGTGSTQR